MRTVLNYVIFFLIDGISLVIVYLNFLDYYDILPINIDGRRNFSQILFGIIFLFAVASVINTLIFLYNNKFPQKSDGSNYIKIPLIHNFLLLGVTLSIYLLADKSIISALTGYFFVSSSIIGLFSLIYRYFKIENYKDSLIAYEEGYKTLEDYRKAKRGKFKSLEDFYSAKKLGLINEIEFMIYFALLERIDKLLDQLLENDEISIYRLGEVLAREYGYQLGTETDQKINGIGWSRFQSIIALAIHHLTEKTNKYKFVELKDNIRKLKPDNGHL